ncbi:MAG: homocitrate synthase [Fidelibacterota bacterium]
MDSTLREGEQTPGVSFSVADKLVLARQVDAFGVDFIELGHPAVSPDVYAAVEALNDLDLNARKMAHGRAYKSDVNDAAAIGVPWMGLFFGTSALSLKYKFNVTRKEALRRIREAVEYAKGKGLKIRFTAEDSSRTDLKFLIQVVHIVTKAGADRFSLADTVGVMTPTRMKEVVRQIVQETDLPVHVHCHNDFGLAVANALSALEAGARCVDVTVNGLGERAGLASLAEVTTALTELYKVPGRWNLDLLPELSALVERASGQAGTVNRPIVGKHAFSHKAGLHVKAVLKNPKSYEGINPAAVARQRKLVLDKYTGRAALDHKLKELGLVLSSRQLNQVLAKIKAEPEKVDWSNEDLKVLVEVTREAAD